ncbi:MAG TPA: MBL fold metallo-hydrolase [Anaerovoracaceae bacterium]|nr:MBL fold metallo-hydrolase [Anaerovoracaceae bacterium]
MIEKILDDLYRIPVPLPGNPLKELNSYFIRGTDGDLLIDLGFRQPECRKALAVGLKELGSAPERRDVLLTHLHSDHSGLANDFVGPGRNIYISNTDKRYLERILRGETAQALHDRYKSEGFPEAMLSMIEKTSPARIYSAQGMGSNVRGLDDGEVIQAGRYHLQTVLVPGHTPGCAMFWLKKQKTMFTGDHVLFDITPNITAWTGIEDSLGNYLDSLRKSQAYPVEMALPGHRKGGDYHERIEKLLTHHDRRIEEALRIIKAAPGLNAYEIASRMKWKIRASNWESFPVYQKWFAVGECLSHLDYLCRRGKISGELINGIYSYCPAQEFI